MKHNPTELNYARLDKGNAPIFGVTDNPSEDFSIASRDTLAWFVQLGDSLDFIRYVGGMWVWDLEDGIKLS